MNHDVQKPYLLDFNNTNFLQLFYNHNIVEEDGP